MNRLIKKWQKILRLEQWKIGYKMVKEFEDYRRAQMHWDAETREGTISILNGQEEQWELLVVHELLHLVNKELWDMSFWACDECTKMIRHTGEIVVREQAYILLSHFGGDNAKANP